MLSKSTKTNTVWGFLSGLTAAAIWGGMYVVSKVVMSVIPPFSLIVTRLVLGHPHSCDHCRCPQALESEPSSILADIWGWPGGLWHFSRLPICRHKPFHSSQWFAGYFHNSSVRAVIRSPAAFRKGHHPAFVGIGNCHAWRCSGY